jgi:hypothetical protein
MNVNYHELSMNGWRTQLLRQKKLMVQFMIIRVKTTPLKNNCVKSPEARGVFSALGLRVGRWKSSTTDRFESCLGSKCMHVGPLPANIDLHGRWRIR